MSTVPAMPPVQPESMTASPTSANLASIIPDDMLYEVVDGQIVEKRMGAREIEIATILVGYLFPFVRANRLGRVLAEFVFRIDVTKDLQRRPDVAFVSSATWPFGRRVPNVPVWDIVPELAIEVISPSNTAFEVQRKTHEYFHAGVKCVWVVWPEEAEIYVYHAPNRVQVLGVGQELDGGDLLPGFRLPVAMLFEDDPE